MDEKDKNEVNEQVESTSLIEQVRSKLNKDFVFGLVDEGVTRITTGMNLNDVRSVLRGDPAGKPNPRVKPHTEGFLFHIRPTFYHEAVAKIYPTFRLGYLSVIFFVIEIITGIFLMVFYVPSPEGAYSSMIKILTEVPFGRMVRDIHRLTAEAMVAIVVLHMLRTFLTGSYKAPRQFTWFTGVILLLFTLGLSFSGYLLPWDQLAFWAVTIGTSMAEAAPPKIVGQNLNLLLRGAADIGANGLLRFYLLHVIFLPLAGLVFLGVHYYKVIRHGHSLPPELEEVGQDTARRVPPDKRVPFLPDILTSEIFWGVMVVAGLLVSVTLAGYHAPLEHHSDPQVTPLHTTAPWYFLWLQGLLKLGDKTLMGIVLPTIIFGFLFALPYIDFNLSRRYKDRRLSIGVGLVFVAILVWLTFVGMPLGDPLTWNLYKLTGVPVFKTLSGRIGAEPPVEVVQEFIPMEGVGAVRALPYEELIPGSYDTQAGTAVAGAPELSKVLNDVSHHIAAYPELPGGHAILVIEDWQGTPQEVTLKKVTMRILWDGMQEPYEKTVYIHRDSNYSGE